MSLAEAAQGSLGYIPATVPLGNDPLEGDEITPQPDCNAGEDHPWDLAMQLLDSTAYECTTEDLYILSTVYNGLMGVDPMERFQTIVAGMYLKQVVPFLTDGWELTKRRIDRYGNLDIEVVRYDVHTRD